jgi:glycogen(starch) synthase
MKILYISSEYPVETGFGGIGTYTKYAAEGMAQRGHEVHVLCRSISSGARNINENGVIVHRIPSLNYQLPQSRLFYIFRRTCYRFLPHTLIRHAWAKTVSAAANELDKGDQFDIIEYPECGAEGLFLKKSLSKRLIVRLHTPWEIVRRFDRLKEAPLDAVLLPYMEKLSAQNANAVSCPSYALADKMKHRWNLGDITVFPNPIPLENFINTKGTGWIYTGRVERRKGVHILVQAYTEVSKRISVPPLYIIGRPYGFMPDGVSYEKHIQNLIDKNDTGNNIKWVKGATLDQVKEYLRNSSVAFLPSLWENFPYSCIEALACSLAVIASDCGGFPEIIKHGENGYLVKPDDKDALISVMHTLIDNPENVNRMSEASRKSVLRFDSDLVCKSIEDFYLQCGAATK